MMRRSTRIGLGTRAVGAAVALVLVGAAAADTGAVAAAGARTPHSATSGTFTETSSVLTSQTTVGDYTFIKLRNVVVWTGPISGTAREELTVVVPPSGDAPFSGFDVCECHAPNGARATVRISLVGVDNGTAFHGKFVIAAAGGALHGFHGSGTFEGSDAQPISGTYTGTFGS